MTTKNLIVLGTVAILLGGAAYVLTRKSTPQSPRLNGEMVLPKLDLASVASVEFGEDLRLSAGTNGWVVETYHGYPASPALLTENL